jgi:RNA polymerase sigma factor (sigma-70 family)
LGVTTEAEAVRTAANHGDRQPAADDVPAVAALARYQPELYAFARHLTRDRAEARDLYEEILRHVSRALEDRGRPAHWRSWLFQIATEVALDEQSPDRQRRAPRQEQADRDRDRTARPDVRRDDHTLCQAVAECVSTLPRQQWVALVQRKYFNFGYAEIAATLSLSEGEARSSVYAALRTMRADLGDRL